MKEYRDEYVSLKVLYIVEYYNYMIDSKYNNEIDNMTDLNHSLRRVIMMFQIKETVIWSQIKHSDTDQLYYHLSLNMRLETFQPKDIILKQEASNDRVFFIINGIVEVIDEQKDYEFYDYNVMGKSIIFLYTIDKYYSVMHNEEILLSTHQSFKINKSMPSERATTRKC